MTTDYKVSFERLMKSLEGTKLFNDMENTVENSPWHREANVLVHTQMVVGEFMKRWEDATDRNMYLGAIAALFHDVGKPAAEEVCHSEERGTYRRYHGHEHISAVMWLEFASSLSADELFNEYQLYAIDVYVIAWMVEYHLPYGVRDKAKREGLKATVCQYGVYKAFTTLLLSDANGRISDDHETKLNNVHAWIAEFDTQTFTPTTYLEDMINVAYVLIGSSSSGKSTVRNNLVDLAQTSGMEIGVFNMDQLRLQTWPSDGTTLEQYEHAVKSSFENESQFKQVCEAELNSLFAAQPDVIVSDNTNLSKKARRAFITKARQKGYSVIAVLMLTSPAVAEKREAARDDRKGVPIRRQFASLTVPTLSTEADSVICLPGMLFR